MRRAAVGMAVAVAPVITMMGVAGVLEPETPRAFALLLLPGLGLLGYLVARERPLLSAALLAGVVGGWTLGAGIRVAMLVAAEMGGGVERSVDGTAGLVLFFAFPGIVLSCVVLALGAFRPLGPRGAAVLVTLVCAALLAGPVRAELLARGNGAVNAVTFLASAAVAGWVIGVAHTRVGAWWERRATAVTPAREAEGVPA